MGQTSRVAVKLAYVVEEVVAGAAASTGTCKTIIGSETIVTMTRGLVNHHHLVVSMERLRAALGAVGAAATIVSALVLLVAPQGIKPSNGQRVVNVFYKSIRASFLREN